MLMMSWLSESSPVAADIPKWYFVGNRTPETRKHSFHSFLPERRKKARMSEAHAIFGNDIQWNSDNYFFTMFNFSLWEFFSPMISVDTTNVSCSYRIERDVSYSLLRNFASQPASSVCVPSLRIKNRFQRIVFWSHSTTSIAHFELVPSFSENFKFTVPQERTCHDRS